MSLRNAAFSAGRWTAASAAGRAAIQLLQSIVLARLLVPEDFGLMALVASFLAVVSLLSDLGLTRALIHFDRPPDPVLSSLFWINLGFCALLAAFVFLVAPVVGRLFGTPELAPLLAQAGLALPLGALGQQHRTLAEKALRFDQLARVEIGAAVAGATVAITAAWAGAGAQALVAGILTTASVGSLFAWLWLSDGHSLRLRADLRHIRPYLAFGGYLVGDNLASTLHRQIDVFIAGLSGKPTELGVFSLPRDLCFRVATLVNPVITRVGFPLMSTLKDEPARLRSIYLQTLRLTASVNFPLYALLIAYAEEVVALLYGPGWEASAPYLRILAAWGLLRSTASPVGNLVQAAGRPDVTFRWNLALLILVPLLLWLAGESAGVYGVACALLVLQVALIVPVWHWLVKPFCHAGLGEYLQQILVPLAISAAATMVAGVTTAPLDSGVLRLGAGGLVGLVAYLGLSLMFNRQWTDAMRELLQRRTGR